jgi:hypothetical protein
MSGGHFDYNQHKFFEIAESIQSIIDRNYVKMSDSELKENFISKETLENNPEYAYYHSFPPEVINKFIEAVNIIRKAYVYAHRIDWLVSGDDSNETFMKRLDDELYDLSKK